MGVKVGESFPVTDILFPVFKSHRQRVRGHPYDLIVLYNTLQGRWIILDPKKCHATGH